MKTILPDVPLKSWLPSAVAREQLLQGWGEPMLMADWDRALMLHYEVPPEVLQPHVPYPLDLRDGKAYVSLVAFTMRDMAPFRGGKWTSWMLKPIATHEFLNVRTYVNVDGEAGIYFLHEWLPNALAVMLGRPVFGLPYRRGSLNYQHDHEGGHLEGTVRSPDGTGLLHYEATLPEPHAFLPCEAGTLTEFLMERYTAFTEWLGRKRCFRIWHPPWPQVAVDPVIHDDSLLRQSCPWFSGATLCGANYSTGAPGVWMSRPYFL